MNEKRRSVAFNTLSVNTDGFSPSSAYTACGTILRIVRHAAIAPPRSCAVSMAAACTTIVFPLSNENPPMSKVEDSKVRSSASRCASRALLNRACAASTLVPWRIARSRPCRSTRPSSNRSCCDCSASWINCSCARCCSLLPSAAPLLSPLLSPLENTADTASRVSLLAWRMSRPGENPRPSNRSHSSCSFIFLAPPLSKK